MFGERAETLMSFGHVGLLWRTKCFDEHVTRSHAEQILSTVDLIIPSMAERIRTSTAQKLRHQMWSKSCHQVQRVPHRWRKSLINNGANAPHQCSKSRHRLQTKYPHQLRRNQAKDLMEPMEPEGKGGKPMEPHEQKLDAEGVTRTKG